MARVLINGKNIGGAWTAPWQVDTTEALKPRTSSVEIRVVNTWVNRLIGDAKLPVAQRETWTNVNPFKLDTPLQPSGLEGEITIRSYPTE
jgi:hypothetical protein